MTFPAWGIISVSMIAFVLVSFIWTYLRFGKFKPRIIKSSTALPVGYVFDPRYGLYYYDPRPNTGKANRRKSGVYMTARHGSSLWAWGRDKEVVTAHAQRHQAKPPVRRMRNRHSLSSINKQRSYSVGSQVMERADRRTIQVRHADLTATQATVVTTIDEVNTHF